MNEAKEEIWKIIETAFRIFYIIEYLFMCAFIKKKC